MFNIFKSTNPLSLAKQELKETLIQRLEQQKAYEYHQAMAKMLTEREARLEIFIEVYEENQNKKQKGVDNGL